MWLSSHEFWWHTWKIYRLCSTAEYNQKKLSKLPRTCMNPFRHQLSMLFWLMLLKCLRPKLWRNSGKTVQNVQFHVQLVLKDKCSFALKFRILSGSLFWTKKVYIFTLTLFDVEAATQNGILLPKLFWPWEKNVLVIKKIFWNLRLKAGNLQKFWDH